MNIFYLNHDPKQCAKDHCDKHVVKMILEYAQLLSTAHRVIDGVQSVGLSKTGRKQTRYVLTDDRESRLYSATHINHPSAAWVRKSYHNYVWLYTLLHHLCKEYTHRYKKVHKVERDDILHKLYLPPAGLDSTRNTITFTEPPPAMPDYCKVVGNSVKSYQTYYVKEKSRFAKWTSREAPAWYVEGTKINANILL